MILQDTVVENKFNRCDAELVERTQAYLDKEISFLPSGGFQQLDAERAWEATLEEAEQYSEVTSASELSRMPAYLEQLCRAPLLTADEEQTLFRQLNYLRYRANVVRSTLCPDNPSRERLDEIDRLLNAALLLRNRITHANVRLVVSIVKTLADEKNRFDDLLSEGIACLMHAVDKFDAGRGFRFSTYATRAVRREVFRLVQRQHRHRNRYVSGSQEAISARLDTQTVPNRTPDEWGFLERTIADLMKSLDDRERFIVQARFGFVSLDSKATFQYLGKLLGVSKERVRQLEQRAMRKLREQVPCWDELEAVLNA